MNVQLKDITVTARDGRVSHLDQVYIRGSHVRFFINPDMLKYVSFPSGCPTYLTPYTFLVSRAQANKHEQERAHVPKSQCPGSWCRSGERTSYRQQSAGERTRR